MNDPERFSSMKCGELWHLPSKASAFCVEGEIRFASFNVERGYHAQKIHDFIVEEAFDVVLLQEVDMGCKRTESRNNMAVIAGDAAFDGVFAVEFEEYDGKERKTGLFFNFPLKAGFSAPFCSSCWRRCSWKWDSEPFPNSKKRVNRLQAAF